MQLPAAHSQSLHAERYSVEISVCKLNDSASFQRRRHGYGHDPGRSPCRLGDYAVTAVSGQAALPESPDSCRRYEVVTAAKEEMEIFLSVVCISPASKLCL